MLALVVLVMGLWTGCLFLAIKNGPVDSGRNRKGKPVMCNE